MIYKIKYAYVFSNLSFSDFDKQIYFGSDEVFILQEKEMDIRFIMGYLNFTNFSYVHKYEFNKVLRLETDNPDYDIDDINTDIPFYDLYKYLNYISSFSILSSNLV